MKIMYKLCFLALLLISFNSMPVHGSNDGVDAANESVNNKSVNQDLKQHESLPDRYMQGNRVHTRGEDGLYTSSAPIKPSNRPTIYSKLPRVPSSSI